MKSVSFLACAGVVLAGSISSCSSYYQQAEVADGLAGTALGTNEAAIPEDNGEDTRQYERYGIQPDQPNIQPQHQGIHDPGVDSAVDPAAANSKYPVASRTNKPNEVASPYPPNHRINIEGFKSGQLAKDPKTGKIFRVP